jgi:hypothetical protein
MSTDLIADTFADELRKELGEAFRVRVDTDAVLPLTHCTATLRAEARVAVDPYTLTEAVSAAPHIADMLKHGIRKAIEDAPGLPDEQGFVKVPIETWQDIRYAMLSHPDACRYADLIDGVTRNG